MQETRHHDWLLVALALGALMLGVIFVSIGAYVLGGLLAPLDQGLREWTVNGRSAGGIRVGTVVSFIGDKIPLAILCAIAGWFLIPGKKWWLVLLVLCALSVGFFVEWLKATYAVIRPEGGLLTSSSHSYPSGHASGTAAIALFFAYVALRARAHARIVVPAAIALTVGVGLSRIYLDEHWGSDVVGGWMVGTAIAMAFGALHELVLRHQRRV
jgi:membrane-associated phospholipid phosphatase